MFPINVHRLRSFFDNEISEEQVEKLQSWGLIPKEGEYLCPLCSEKLKLRKDCSRLDNYLWRCGNKKYRANPKTKQGPCPHTASFRKETFFEKSQLSIGQILGFAHLWSGGNNLTTISEELEISYKTCVDIASFCRKVVYHHLILNPEKIGGPGKVVEIDESKFGKRKYHRGHHVEGQWVFGGIERGSGKLFMVVVENRGTETLIPIIKTWIHEGTTIVSDCWKAYDCLEEHGYQHLKVNHSVNFVDPETGAHTNSIEASWRAAKAALFPSGRIKPHIPGNLARYMFVKKFKTLNLNRSEEFFKLAGQLYSPTAPQIDDNPDDIDNDSE